MIYETEEDRARERFVLDWYLEHGKHDATEVRHSDTDKPYDGFLMLDEEIEVVIEVKGSSAINKATGKPYNRCIIDRQKVETLREIASSVCAKAIVIFYDHLQNLAWVWDVTKGTDDALIKRTNSRQGRVDATDLDEIYFIGKIFLPQYRTPQWQQS